MQSEKIQESLVYWSRDEYNDNEAPCYFLPVDRCGPAEPVRWPSPAEILIGLRWYV